MGDAEARLTAVRDVAAANGTLAAAAMRGDRSALEALWREHRRWVAAVLLAHKSAGDQLDDLLQEVAMTLVTRIDGLRDPGNVRAWLRTVAINAARASARSGRVRPWHRTTGDVPAAAPAAARREHGLDDEAHRLLGLAAELPAPYREPLLLRAVQGLSGRTIGAIMDLPEATVETRIARARRMIRQRLEELEAPRRRDEAAAPAGPGFEGGLTG